VDLHERVAKQLAVTLKALMKERDLTISALHKRTGIGRETLYRILRHESLPTTEVLLRLAAELEVPPAALLDSRAVGAPKTPVEECAIFAALQSIEGRLERIERLIERE
jgi:transcriptional regulator with XRE-family HTH domain